MATGGQGVSTGCGNTAPCTCCPLPHLLAHLCLLHCLCCWLYHLQLLPHHCQVQIQPARSPTIQIQLGRWVWHPFSRQTLPAHSPPLHKSLWKMLLIQVSQAWDIISELVVSFLTMMSCEEKPAIAEKLQWNKDRVLVHILLTIKIRGITMKKKDDHLEGYLVLTLWQR